MCGGSERSVSWKRRTESAGSAERPLSPGHMTEPESDRGRTGQSEAKDRIGKRSQKDVDPYNPGEDSDRDLEKNAKGSEE